MLSGRVILIVDDDEILRDFLAKACAKEGAVVMTASGGNEAFKIIQETLIDLVVSDIRMPQGDGISLLKNIRSIDGPQPGVILISGFNDQRIVKAAGFESVTVISKPFGQQEIIKLMVPKLNE